MNRQVFTTVRQLFWRFWFLAAIFLLLVSLVTSYEIHLAKGGATLTAYLKHVAFWRKHRQDLVAEANLETNNVPIHFEFYSTLPNMKVAEANEPPLPNPIPMPLMLPPAEPGNVGTTGDHLASKPNVRPVVNHAELEAEFARQIKNHSTMRAAK